MRRLWDRDAAVALLALVLGGVAAGSACKSSSDAPRVARSAVAGRVLEVKGSVSVAGKPLVAGDTVAPGDTIDTGADGSVVIELAHNLARWELGPNKHVRVDQSLAWNEPRRTAPTVQVEQDTASAGRPAERNAMDTVATALDDTGADQAPAEAQATERAAPPPKTSEREPRPSKMGLGGLGEGGGGIGTGDLGTIGKGGGTGTGYGAGAGSLRSNGRSAPKVRQGAPQVSGALAPEVIRRVVRAQSGRLRFCYEQRLKVNPKLEGRVVVKLAIDASGKVTTATDAGSVMPDAEVVSCVVRAFLTFKFPAPDGGGVVTVVYPIHFAPAAP